MHGEDHGGGGVWLARKEPGSGVGSGCDQVEALHPRHHRRVLGDTSGRRPEHVPGESARRVRPVGEESREDHRGEEQRERHHEAADDPLRGDAEPQQLARGELTQRPSHEKPDELTGIICHNNRLINKNVYGYEIDYNQFTYL